ncbi:MAG: DUF362 domain-containing protein [Phycisphaerae bacterium]|nr:DUF362 domain-containing protein [Phycisphaerae bacterium]
MSKVFFVEASIREGEKALSEKARRLFQAGGFARCFKNRDFTAVKVHVGEEGNTTYIKAPCLKGLIEELLALKTKPFLTDTSTLYVGRRHNAVDHAILASQHGFSYEGLGVPFVPPDGLLGTSETPVRIDGELSQEVFIATDIVRCQSILSVAHVTGHLASGLAATIKTLGMGCASRKGKMRQHSALRPRIKGAACRACGECVQRCPERAIALKQGKAQIDPDLCVGCAECVAVCRFGAVQWDWGQESEVLQKAMAEHALGVVKGKEGRAVFFNFVLSVTPDCDCMDTPDMPRVAEDIGILASEDPVAVDQAAIDLVERRADTAMAKLIKRPRLDPCHQIRHGARIGLGSTDYDLVAVEDCGQGGRIPGGKAR